MIIAHFRRSIRQHLLGRASEWALAVMIFNWGIILNFVGPIFDRPIFADLAANISQESWSIVCMVLGGGRIIVLIINGAWRGSPHLRGGLAFLSMFFWFEISLGLFKTGIPTTGLAIYPVLFFLDLANVLRAADEAAIVDRTLKEEPHGTLV